MPQRSAQAGLFDDGDHCSVCSVAPCACPARLGGAAQFSTITMDPPWPERGGGKVKRGADRHYPTMTPADILAAIVRAEVWRPAPDAHLWMWVTNNWLPAGLELMRALGFRYVTNLAWDKVGSNLGIGQYLRGAHELCLFGVRGQGFAVRTEHRDIPSVIRVPVPTAAGQRIHSRKPEAFFNLVEMRSYGPYLEMFARVERPGWTAWGNEIPSAAAGPE